MKKRYIGRSMIEDSISVLADAIEYFEKESEKELLEGLLNTYKNSLEELDRETIMTNTDQIIAFVENGNKYCDDCLSETLDIKPRQQVNHIVRKLEKESSYERDVRECESCTRDKKVLTKF